jgi:hypothetical protein
LSIDPVTTDANTGGSFNRYSYANNNPYRYIDPDGRWPEAVEAEMTKNFQTILSISSPGMSAADKNSFTASATVFINENYNVFTIVNAKVSFTPLTEVVNGKTVITTINFEKKDFDKLKALQGKMAIKDPKAAAALKAAIEEGIKSGAVWVDRKRVSNEVPKKEEPKKLEPNEKEK